jgi:hypothetical protein
MVSGTGAGPAAAVAAPTLPIGPTASMPACACAGRHRRGARTGRRNLPVR